jgi:hypothetical protein
MPFPATEQVAVSRSKDAAHFREIAMDRATLLKLKRLKAQTRPDYLGTAMDYRTQGGGAKPVHPSPSRPD